MNKLFDDKDQYTIQAQLIRQEIYGILIKLIRKHTNQGYSIREIGYILFSSISDVINELIIERMINE